MNKTEAGQSTIEYALLIAGLIVALVAIQYPMRATMGGYWRQLTSGETLYAPQGRTSGTEDLTISTQRTDTFSSKKCDPDTEDCGPNHPQTPPGRPAVKGNEVTRFTTSSTIDHNDTDVRVKTQVQEHYEDGKLFQ